MSKINIRKIEVSGPKGTSVLEFGKQLTIIGGKTETGKSTIFKCIDYIFGAKADNKHRPFLVTTGYDTIKGYFDTDLGNVTITREIDSKFLSVETSNPRIDTTIKYHCESTNKNWIGRVFNIILGVDENFRIPKAVDGKMQRFSWKLLCNTFMIEEHKTETKTSVLLPTESTQQTAYLSSLLFLLYGLDFSDYDAEDGTRIKKIKKAAVQKYITSKKEEVIAQLEQLRKEKIDRGIVDESVDEILRNLSLKIDEINARIKEITDTNEGLSEKIGTKTEEEKQAQFTIQSFEDLSTLYQSDIKRLLFIVDGKKKISPRQAKSKCPFCSGDIIEPIMDENYIQSAKAELQSIISKNNELISSIEETKAELKEIQEAISILKKSIEKNTLTIKKTLNPELQKLLDEISKYKEYIELNNKIKILEDALETYDSDFTDNGADTVEKIEYKPKELFRDDFESKISDYCVAMLREMNFSPIESVRFDKLDFDIVVNNNPKINRSKGYSAIFNSTLLLALRKYINDGAFINPHFYFIDSPLHGLMTEFDNEDLKNDLRKGFFRYLYSNLNEDQIIIIENTDEHELPEITDNENIKVYIFTGDENNGRYGFLDNVVQN